MRFTFHGNISLFWELGVYAYLVFMHIWCLCIFGVYAYLVFMHIWCLCIFGVYAYNMYSLPFISLAFHKWFAFD